MAEFTIADVMTALDDMRTSLVDRLDGIDGRLEDIRTEVKILSAKQVNSTKGRRESLVVVPKADGQLPISEYPASIEHLIVAGNEALPSGAANNWNRAKENNKSFATKLLCSDDYLTIDALKTQLDILKMNETAIIFSERYIVFPNGKKLHPRLPKYASNISFNDAFKCTPVHSFRS
jgi:hypothetical protein